MTVFIKINSFVGGFARRTAYFEFMHFNTNEMQTNDVYVERNEVGHDMKLKLPFGTHTLKKRKKTALSVQ